MFLEQKKVARSSHSFWTPMMTMLFLTEEEEEEEDDDDAHPSSETSMRLWGEAGEEEDNTNTNTNTNRGAEGIARSRAGFSATGSPRTKMMIPGNKTGRRRRPERRLC